LGRSPANTGDCGQSAQPTAKYTQAKQAGRG
jgi:hypothetical protein